MTEPDWLTTLRNKPPTPSGSCDKCGKFTKNDDLIQQTDWWPFGLFLCPTCNAWVIEYRRLQDD